MNTAKRIFLSLSVFLTLLFGATIARAQDQPIEAEAPIEPAVAEEAAAEAAGEEGIEGSPAVAPAARAKGSRGGKRTRFAGGKKRRAAKRRGGDPRPNIVTIMVDDQAMNTWSKRFMPRTFRYLVRQGTRIKDGGYAVPPLCCPSRAGFQTGQYPHNHQVYNNNPGFGAFADPSNQIASWLRGAGYRTGFVGKYMNGFDRRRPVAGYDYWWAILGKPHYENYRASEQGGPKRRYRGKRNYVTNRITAKSRRFIRRSAKRNKPFFLWTSHYAPHPRRSNDKFCGRGAPSPLKRDWKKRFRRLPLPKSPNFNERDISDKPEIVRAPRLRRGKVRKIVKHYRCAVATLQAVDRSVAQIVRELRRAGELKNTIIVYVSDNGYYFGEHRSVRGKIRPWEEALRVPFAIRAPRKALGAKPVSRLGEMVATIDLAPTFLELAEAEPCMPGTGRCRTMDGRSLVGILSGDHSQWPENRELVLQIANACYHGYRAIRDERYLYVEWAKGPKDGNCHFGGAELYDLEADPYQLENLIGPATVPPRFLGDILPPEISEVAERYAERLEELHGCNGIAGRDEESGQPLCG